MAYNIVRPISYFLRPLSIWSRAVTNEKIFISCYQCQKKVRLLSTVYAYDYPYDLLKTKYDCNITRRYYAKGKDKKKDKGKSKLDENILVDIIDLEKTHKQFQVCVDSLKEDFTKNLSLRSTSGAIESLTIKFDGDEYKLQELAQIIRQNPKSIILNMSSFPQAIPAVLESIERSGMNLNPQQDGTKLFIPVPKVTKELRESLAKNAKAMFVKCRTHLKDVQNKLIKTIKNKEKSEGLSVDLSRSAAEQITGLCDQYVVQAEKILTSKQAELKGEAN